MPTGLPRTIVILEGINIEIVSSGTSRNQKLAAFSFNVDFVQFSVFALSSHVRRNSTGEGASIIFRPLKTLKA